ncbi:hypothetical protein KR044_008553 [Drosophila immigrans]|nr:hypothetical protein KR044_008553 [Drosophila immigrans]
MTSTSNLADVVRHYQRSIERHNEDETRLLHCITKLFNLPITFEHLQETGIGKTVNALRKINGEVGVAAKTLVTKWKAMVAAEEEPTAAPASNSNEDDSNRSTNGRRSSEEDQDQENKGSNSSGAEDTRSTQKHKSSSKHEERRPKSGDHKSSNSSSHSSSKSHSKSRSESDKKHKSSSDEKSRHHSSKEQKSSSSSIKSKDSLSSHGNPKSSSESSKQKHHSSSSHKSEHNKSKHEKSKEDKSHHHSSEQKLAKDKADKHKSSSTSTSTPTSSSNKSSSSAKRTRSPQRLDEESPKSKKPKSKPKADVVEQQKETADGFDSSMGANFDDVLGMLNIPLSGKKSSLKLKPSPHKPTTTTPATTAAAPSAAKRIPATASVPSNMRLTSTRKPELLAPSAKLEPLDPSIALELPTISNNYKPMPLNQTVMDVVFNQGVSSSVHRPSRINESEALAAGISSKTMRTKIYSGVRTGQILQVPSLFDLCIRVLQKNIDALEYTGGVPFEVLRAVLERATPHQLLNFEEYNPYLMEDSDVLWQQHVHRNYRGQRREEMETWREMFLRCEDEKARKLSVIAENIKASQKISEAPVRKTQLAFVDSMVKPPRSVQRKQEQYGTNRKLIATPAARVAALSNVTPNAAKVGDARLRVLSSARDAAQVSAAPMRNKKAPLMAKALQLIRGRQRR